MKDEKVDEMGMGEAVNELAEFTTGKSDRVVIEIKREKFRRRVRIGHSCLFNEVIKSRY